MNARAAFVNDLWLLASRAEARRFRRATRDVAATQRRLLQAYLAENRDTVFGRRHDFASLTPEAYARRVPLSTYDDYVEPIGHIADGEHGVLTAAPVQMFELSSGSAAATKMIPYTAALKA